MATTQAQKCISLEAGADLSANQFHFVVMDADGQLSVATDGAAAIGVLQDDPAAAGRVAEVCIEGQTKVEAGGDITAGDPVSSNSTGEAISAGTNDVILGTALDDGADGTIIRIVFQPRGAFA